MSAYLDWARPRLATLQEATLHGTRLRADMAALRASLNQPCGTNTRAASWSLAGIPCHRNRRNPNRLERASWTAFALYAHHQQGDQEHPMFAPGTRLADACERLADQGADPTKPLQRLLATHGMDAATGPLLRIIQLLADHDIPLDHATLALDLTAWDDPSKAGTIRASWLRALR